jgi:hypothetical protein
MASGLPGLGFAGCRSAGGLPLQAVEHQVEAELKLRAVVIPRSTLIGCSGCEPRRSPTATPPRPRSARSTTTRCRSTATPSTLPRCWPAPGPYSRRSSGPPSDAGRQPQQGIVTAPAADTAEPACPLPTDTVLCQHQGKWKSVGWPQGRVAGALQPPGSHRSQRDVLPSPGSCRPHRQAVVTHNSAQTAGAGRRPARRVCGGPASSAVRVGALIHHRQVRTQCRTQRPPPLHAP